MVVVVVVPSTHSRLRLIQQQHGQEAAHQGQPREPVGRPVVVVVVQPVVVAVVAARRRLRSCNARCGVRAERRRGAMAAPPWRARTSAKAWKPSGMTTASAEPISRPPPSAEAAERWDSRKLIQ